MPPKSRSTRKPKYQQMQTPQQRKRAAQAEHRAFAGRERKLQNRDALPQVLIAALDILARFRATQEPIQNIINPILKTRRFGNQERNNIRDWIFQLQRGQAELSVDLARHLKEVGGTPPDRRMQDLALLLATVPEVILATFESKTASLLPQSLQAFVIQARQRSSTTSLPKWLAESLRSQFGNEADNIETAFLQKAVPAFAVDTRIVSRADVLAYLENLNLPVRPFDVCDDGFWSEQHLPLSRIPKDMAAAVWPMDLGSQLIAHFVGAQHGERVLDMCAGGGGKTQALLRTGCKLVATDVSPKRIAAAKKRHGLHQIPFHCFDMTEEHLTAESFDRILVDAPCSGTGTLRRHPDLLSRLSAEDVVQYERLQKALLKQAHRLVRSDGWIVYATCSFLHQENDAIADWAEAELGLTPCPLNELKPDGILPEADLASNRLHILPHVFRSDGFFVAAFRKQ